MQCNRILCNLSIVILEGGVVQSDGHRQERLPVALCGASRGDESGTESAPVIVHHAVEGVEDIVHDVLQPGQHPPLQHLC